MSRVELSGGWEAACCEPDRHTGPGGLGGLEWIAARVPGTAAGALRDAGRWRSGESLDLDAEDWWFRTRFEARPAAPGEEVVLCLDGIATVWEAFLNGEPIAAGESMFAADRIDVGARLRDGENELAIRCRALAPLLRQRRKPRARWRTRLVDGGLRFYRTMLLGRAPGFAPGPAAVGPWRAVALERRRAAVVEELALRTRLRGGDGVLSVLARVRSLGGTELRGAEVALCRGGEERRQRLTVEPGPDGETRLSGELTVPDPERWWPHTHGEPALYEARLVLGTAAGELAVDAGRVGFRELAPGAGTGHDPIADGLDLHLNGIRVFARGAVWTPVDFAGLAAGVDELRERLGRVVAAGMNMLRIPGTAAYESPLFHDLCDELGILVWQDLMFANMDYPIDEEGFRDAVVAEVGAVLGELGGRPSTAVICGNSEVEQQAAMMGLGPEAGRGELFGELVPRLVEEADLDVPYVPSAPCGGALPFRPGSGIANYYGVGGYRRPLTDARLAGVRFAAECLAFANVPDQAALEAIMPEAPADVVVHHPRWKAGVPRDAGAGWDFDDVRDHYLQSLFGLDPAELRRWDHERYLELSRAVSGEAMAAVFGEWRRGGSSCGGGLVLWLGDLAPGAGWGLLDHTGAPKWAYHRLRQVLAPVAVWMTDEGLAGVGVHLANDGAAPLAATLRLALYRDGQQPVGEVERELELPARGALSLDLEEVLGRFADASWAYRFGPPAQDAIFATLLGTAGEEEPIAQAAHFPAGFPLEREDAARLGLEVEVERGIEQDLLVRLRCERVVHGVRLEIPGYEPECQAFSLEPGRAKVLALHRRVAVEVDGRLRLSALNLRGSVTIPAP